jgi:hypothetical protein
MAFTTYAELQSTVADYLARSDLTSQIQDFISLAETRLNRDLRIRQMLTYTTITMTADSPNVTIPADFLSIRDIHIIGSPVYTLKYESPSNLFRNTDSYITALPKFYTTVGAQFVFSPIPDTAYVLQILYYAKPPVLSDANTSNVWLVNCPDALLYAALAEAEPYLMNDARVATWAALYDRAIAAVTASDDSSENAGSPLAITIAAR